MIDWLKSWLAHPLTRGMDLDDPRTTVLRRQIIRSNPFLQRIYREWYRFIVASLPPVAGPVLELGSGAGFLNQYIPGLLTSDLLPVPDLSLMLDAHHLPFADQSLRAIVLVNVLHHFADLNRFLTEASRCLKSCGRIIMVEPWVTWWSLLIYPRLHHEPLDTTVHDWCFPASGPLSGANMALPWIAFHRDRLRFDREFPMLTIQWIRPVLPVSYLLSGGVSMRPLMPGWSFPIWRSLENCLQPWSHLFGMFAELILEHR
ncbi:MAG: class I SAM-dependent methyltransferase [Bacillota bacterium]